MNTSCQALCRSLASQNESADISQSVLYTSLMGLLLVADKEGSQRTSTDQVLHCLQKDAAYRMLVVRLLWLVDTFQSSSDTERELKLGSGRVGLWNAGNTCFLNAIVQCLAHTESLRDYCLTKSYLRDMYTSQEPVLMNEFTKVLEGLWQTDGGDTTVNPNKFYHVFKEAVPYFSGYSQQDAQEFLRFLLDRLHMEINRRPPPRPTSATTTEENLKLLRLSEEASTMWKRHLDKDDSIIVDLFSGQLRSTLHCSTCSHYSTTFDVFCDLSLSVPRSGESRSGVTLRECLDLFSQEEKLDKDNSPMCERCHCRTECIKSLTIQKFPKVLVIHLKRFTASRYSIHKSTVPVSFPLNDLDLGPFGPANCGPVLYDLYALCNHTGTVSIGHYTAACQVEGGWCCYNDSCVTQLSVDQLQSSQAYLLFYKLKNSTACRK